MADSVPEDQDLQADEGFNLEDTPAVAGSEVGALMGDNVDDLSVFDSPASDEVSVVPAEEGQDAPETPAEETDAETPGLAPEDEADWIASLEDMPEDRQLRAIRRVAQDDPAQLRRLLLSRNTDRRTTETDAGLRQRISDLEQQVRQPAAPAVPAGPPVDPLEEYTTRFMQEHGREPQPIEIVQGMARQEARRAAAEEVGQLQMMAQFNQQEEALYAEFPWAAEHPEFLQEASMAVGAWAMKPGRGLRKGDLQRAFRGVAGDEIARRATERTATARGKQAAAAGATPAVPPVAAPGEQAPNFGTMTPDQIRAYNKAKYG